MNRCGNSGFETIAASSFPMYVMFDVTNKCNAKCLHCPQSVGFSGMDDWQFLDLGIFKKVIDQCRGRELEFVRITGDGEPLLHPDIWELLAYPSTVNVGPLGLTTNGSALNEKNRKKLLNSDIFMVDVSIDAFSEDVFEKVRVGLSYSTVIENLLNLVKERDAAGSEMKIAVSFVEQALNAHQPDEFREYWEQIVDEVIIRKMITNVGKNVIDLKNPEASRLEERWPCPHVFRRVVVNYDGRLKACPIDWESKLISGSASEDIVSVWNNEFYQDLRTQHLNNEFKDDCICSDCDDWRGTPWSMGYEKIIARMKSE